MNHAQVQKSSVYACINYVEYASDDWPPGIFEHASTELVNYRKWVGPSIATTERLHFELKVWCSSVA